MCEYYVDIRCKVKAEDIHQAVDKVIDVEEYIVGDENVECCFIKQVGLCLEYRDMCVGDDSC